MIKTSAKHQCNTQLKGKLNNLKTWSSTFSMLQRYTDIPEYMPQIDDDTVNKL